MGTATPLFPRDPSSTINDSVQTCLHKNCMTQRKMKTLVSFCFCAAFWRVSSADLQVKAVYIENLFPTSLPSLHLHTLLLFKNQMTSYNLSAVADLFLSVQKKPQVRQKRLVQDPFAFLLDLCQACLTPKAQNKTLSFTARTTRAIQLTPVLTSRKPWFPSVTFTSDNEAFFWLQPTHDTLFDDVKKQLL